MITVYILSPLPPPHFLGVPNALGGAYEGFGWWNARYEFLDPFTIPINAHSVSVCDLDIWVVSHSCIISKMQASGERRFRSWTPTYPREGGIFNENI